MGTDDFGRDTSRCPAFFSCPFLFPDAHDTAPVLPKIFFFFFSLSIRKRSSPKSQLPLVAIDDG